MNDLERRFYCEPSVRKFPVGQQTEIKEMFQKILREAQEENPHADLSSLLSEPVSV